MKDALSFSMEEVAAADRAALDRDRETAKVIAAGGVEGLRKFCELIRLDIAGFEKQVWGGRKDRNDLTLDDLIAMRAYAERLIVRAEFFINLAEQPGTASKEDSGKS